MGSGRDRVRVRKGLGLGLGLGLGIGLGISNPPPRSEHLYRSKSLKPVSGLSAAHLKSLATPLQAVLVTISTDKVANTPAFECKAFYQQTALNRLYSEAFTPLPMVDVDEHSYPLPVQLEAVELWAPWALNSEFSASILFPTPKLHKRAKDPMAYRYITSACSDYSKPVSDETVRVLTFLMGEARNKCIQLGLKHNAKYWWAIDCTVIPQSHAGLNCLTQPNSILA